MYSLSSWRRSATKVRRSAGRERKPGAAEPLQLLDALLQIRRIVVEAAVDGRTFVEAVALDKELQFAGLMLPQPGQQDNDQGQQPGDGARGAAEAPGQAAFGLATALAEGIGLFQTLAEQFGNAVRLARPGVGAAERGTTGGGGPQVQVEATEVRRPLGAFVQQFLEGADNSRLRSSMRSIQSAVPSWRWASKSHLVSTTNTGRPVASLSSPRSRSKRRRKSAKALKVRSDSSAGPEASTASTRASASRTARQGAGQTVLGGGRFLAEHLFNDAAIGIDEDGGVGGGAAARWPKADGIGDCLVFGRRNNSS